MHITRLRLLGFKSFVEPAELMIERGLTGVVGPNGCGKSNLLEALRWVMGETSYKSMRASSMEDVIFSGTTSRPARNIAEVAITLDNRDRKAHAAFNDEDNLEITRRIERDSGSEYRINGKPVRARDVQLLFADASTGAHSPALVQQGRIGEIVSAKPAQRRHILEEAAGISGLHSRRHEAEIKLRGAENNLERLQDIMDQMQGTLSGLRRQERQVTRYRALSRDIERLALLLHYREFLGREAASLEAEQHFQAALLVVGEKTRAEAECRKRHTRATGQLPKLRDRESVAAAIVQRLTLEKEQLEHEHQNQQRRKAELASRCAQTKADLAREEQNSAEHHQHLSRLQKELEQLKQEENTNQQAREPARLDVEKTGAVLARAERDLLVLRTRHAEQKAAFKARQREKLEKQDTVHHLTRRLAQNATDQQALAGQLAQLADFDSLRQTIDQLNRQRDELDNRVRTDEEKLETARTRESEALHHQMEAGMALQTLKAEITTLEDLLQTAQDPDDRPVLEELSVTPGYETALGAALGDDLDASLNNKSSLFWSTSTDSKTTLPPLPEGALPLHQLVRAPDALSQRLHMTGIVPRGEGDELQSRLLPGQRLVSVEGDLWRWDGYTSRAEAPTNSARRLEQKNHLQKLRQQLAGRQKKDTKARATLEQARSELTERKVALENTRNLQTDLRREHEAARRRLTDAERQSASLNAKIEAARSSERELKERLSLEESRLQEILSALSRHNDLPELEQQIDRENRTIEGLRSRYLQAKARSDQLERAEQGRLSRYKNLNAEIRRANERHKQSLAHMDVLQKRLETDRQELDRLADLPDRIRTRQEALHEKLAIAEEKRRLAADALQENENVLRELDRNLRDMQAEAGAAREHRAGCEARLEAARTRLDEQERLIRSELHCAPAECLQRAGLESVEQLPEQRELERQHKKLTADRERLGNVNLRAETEARELAARIDEMSHEHDDLIEAITALRTAISSLNREGRRRLLGAFKEINDHFETLFTTLFGGGKARLELVESDDPLQAGLEIIASPPGKKPQVLTLLSGGEKALTALSLIFAVFLTNPAPICVLDEVDAPLDDANVERFCTLLDEMTKKTDTRFLVITHHPTTMSHMDRLFGVTMAEKGISQMVSVDLSTAESYRDSAPTRQHS